MATAPAYASMFCFLDSLAQHGPEVFKLFQSRDSGTAEKHGTSSVWRGGPAVAVPDVHGVRLL